MPESEIKKVYLNLIPKVGLEDNIAGKWFIRKVFLGEVCKRAGEARQGRDETSGL